MTMKRQTGGATLPLLLLVLAMGIGGYNYHRNWTAERAAQGPRPFEGYSAGDLTKLRDAYAQEMEQFEQRYALQRSRRVRATGEGLMGERLEEFERIQQTSTQLREIATEVADRQARLGEIERELAYRTTLDDGFALHMRRLTRI